MRIAIVSDIHEDIEMLEKAFQTIQKAGYDLLVCLGDITGYAKEFYQHWPNANACIELIRENADLVIAGNHDLFLAGKLPSYYQKFQVPENWYKLSLEERRVFSDNGLWLYEEELIPQLTAPNLQFLSALPEFEILRQDGTGLIFSHFVLPDLCGITNWFPQNTLELRNHFRFMAQTNVSYSFVGHTHPWSASVAGRLVWNDDFFPGRLLLKKSPQIVFCPPITGNKKKSGFIVYDSKSKEISQFRLT